MVGLSTVAHAAGRLLGQPARRVLPAFAAVALISILSTLLVYWMGLRVASANQAVLRNQQIISGLEDLLSTLKDAQVGERGFLLSGDEKVLVPYHAAMARTAAHFGRLYQWSQTGDVDTNLARSVTHLTMETLDGLKEAIAVRRRDGLRGAMASVQSNLGERAMNDLRKQVTLMEDQEKADLAQSMQQRDAATQRRTLATAISSVVTLLFLAWALRRIQQAIASVDRQKQLLAVTLASIGDGVMVTDTQGCVTYLNHEAERLTGWTTQEASDQPLSSIFHIINEQTREPAQSPADSVLRQGEVGGPANHTLLIARDGREIPIDHSAAPMRDSEGVIQGVVLVIRDFTQRRHAEESLHNAAQRLKSHLQHSPVAVIEFDTDLRITRWTDAAHRIFGWTVDEVLGRGMWEIPWICEDDRAKVAGVSAQLLAGTQPCIVSPNRNLRKDGSVIWCEWYNSSLRDEHGKLDSIFSVVLDVTQRVKAQEAAQHARIAAETASKAKDHFIAVLSHELRNPLNPVLAAATMLRRDPRFDANAVEQLEIICRNVELEARLIDDLLDMTRIERGKVELERRRVKLCAIIRRAAEVCMPEIIAKRLDFRMDLGHTTSWVEGDAARLEQVFWNLIKNAVKFTPAGGWVSVRCRHDKEDHVVAEVSDSGKGIEKVDLDRIFNAFEQAERSITRQFGGLGLGLTISKTMVEMHGGSISVHSEGQGKGSTFTVRLPMLRAQARDPAIPPITTEASPPAALGRLRILLVEDHADTARIMGIFLRSRGQVVETADTVAAALKLAEEQPFDLLLSDLGLPDGTGLELMRALRARGSRLPGIALSGYGQEKDVQQARDAGFIAHLTKPVSLPRLEEAIARIAGNGTDPAREAGAARTLATQRRNG